MKNNRYIIPTLSLLALAACDSNDWTQETATGKNRVEVSAEINARSSLDGESFTDGDSFILYQGNPSDDANTPQSEYVYSSGNGWTGAPGLYWDDLNIWGGAKEVNFTAVLANGGTLTPSGTDYSFAVADDQRELDENEFLKNDLLVAYGREDAGSASNRKVKLAFKHVMARLTVIIEEDDTDDNSPPIMSSLTTLTIDKAMIGNTVEFDASAQKTTVEGGGTLDEVTMRKMSEVENTFKYGAILPAQDLSSATIVIGDNVNGKTYNFKLSNLTVSEGNEQLLLQGYHTQLKLKIAKTEVETGAITITEWTGMSASAVAYPDDYPELEIGGDDGEEEEPINPQDDYAGKTIKLTGDIDASQLSLPIGTKAVPFRGTFDGQGYTITGVELTMDDEAFLGVFGYTDGATIRNLNIDGVKINNGNQNTNTATGGLAGYVNNTIIENCHVTYRDGVSAAYDNAGGLVGYVYGTTRIRNCSAHTGVKGGHDYVGGFIGRGNEHMIISKCFSTGDVEAETGYYVGGFAGYTKGGTIEYCYTLSPVRTMSARYAGGFIGRAVGTELTNSYAAGSELTAGTPKGGLIGYSECAPQRCYWNAALAEGRGAMGNSPDNSNSSFTLLKIEAAMGTVLNGLNRTATGETVSVWKLSKGLDDYVLPVLVDNPGKAEPTDED